jgi:hypothetical protein
VRGTTMFVWRREQPLRHRSSAIQPPLIIADHLHQHRANTQAGAPFRKLLTILAQLLQMRYDASSAIPIGPPGCVATACAPDSPARPRQGCIRVAQLHVPNRLQ